MKRAKIRKERAPYVRDGKVYAAKIGPEHAAQLDAMVAAQPGVTVSHVVRQVIVAGLSTMATRRVLAECNADPQRQL